MKRSILFRTPWRALPFQTEYKSWLSCSSFRPWKLCIKRSGAWHSLDSLEEDLSRTIGLGAQLAPVRWPPVREHVHGRVEDLHLLPRQVLHHPVHWEAKCNIVMSVFPPCLASSPRWRVCPSSWSARVGPLWSSAGGRRPGLGREDEKWYIRLRIPRLSRADRNMTWE